MIARDSPWYAVDHGREHPNSELLRLSTAIPFHIKTAALMCMQIYPGVHLQKVMEDLVQRVVHLMAHLLERHHPMDSESATIHLMSTLYAVPTINVHKVAEVLQSWHGHGMAPLHHHHHHHARTHGDECDKTLHQCRESVQSAWERMRALVGYNQFAAHQQYMIAHSPAYDRQLVEKVDEVWEEGARAAQRTSSNVWEEGSRAAQRTSSDVWEEGSRAARRSSSEHTSLPKEFNKSRLRHLPFVALAALGIGALGVGLANGGALKQRASAVLAGRSDDETRSADATTTIQDPEDDSASTPNVLVVEHREQQTEGTAQNKTKRSNGAATSITDAENVQVEANAETQSRVARDDDGKVQHGAAS